MAYDYTSIKSEVQALVQDKAAKLTEGITAPAIDGFDRAIASAIRKYNEDEPMFVKMEVTSTGEYTYNVYETLSEVWAERTNRINSIEYPVGKNPPSYLAKDSYYIYDDGSAQDGSNIALKFLFIIPTDDKFIVEFRRERSLPKDGEQNFPQVALHFDRITNLATSLACTMLAAAYAPALDNSVGADFVNFGNVHKRYSDLADTYMKAYNRSVFGEDEPSKDVQPALYEMPMEARTIQGRSYVFHGSGSRGNQ